uniref:Uncharacterized protein n=1 Tax=viral metagenome TaxID=1070528 RepID=A0A6M3LQP5_9ZZZZ
MDNIEDTIFEDSLPINSIAMCNRLIEILREADTNCALGLRDDKKRKEELIKYRKCLWLINSQIFGQLGVIDMSEEWDHLKKFQNKKR